MRTHSVFICFRLLFYLLFSIFSKQSKGCGNSLLSEEMFADGYQHIHNIDYSSPVIEQMSTHCDKCSQMKWSVMNCLDLQFDDQFFDVVIEKATIDALLTEETNPWDISQESRDKLSSVLKEVYRVLRSEGQFLSISFFAAHFRYPLYKKCLDTPPNNQSSRLQMKGIHELGTNFHYYCYQLIKSGDKTIEFEPNLYEPPKMISGLDINQSTHNSDNNSKDETRAQEKETYLFDINL